MAMLVHVPKFSTSWLMISTASRVILNEVQGDPLTPDPHMTPVVVQMGYGTLNAPDITVIKTGSRPNRELP